MSFFKQNLRTGNKFVLCCFVLSVVLSFYYNTSDAQASEKKWWLNAGITLNKLTFIDESFSSQPYSGVNYGAVLSMKKQSGKVFQELCANYSAGNISTNIQPQADLARTYFSADYTGLFNVFSSHNNSLQGRAGGSINVLYTNRDYKGFINKSSSFDFALSLGGTVQVVYFFSNGQNGLSVSNTVSMPVISLVKQTAFGSENSGENKISGLSSFLRIQNRLRLEKKMNERQALSLFYDWNCYDLSGSNHIKQSIHQIGFMYGLRI